MIMMNARKEATWADAEDMRWAIHNWAVELGVQVNCIHVRVMKTKWASISTAGRITIDRHLIDLPRPLGEYVILHELVHLLAPNHGKVFKSYLNAYMPDWREREELLQAAVRRR